MTLAQFGLKLRHLGKRHRERHVGQLLAAEERHRYHGRIGMLRNVVVDWRLVKSQFRLRADDVGVVVTHDQRARNDDDRDATQAPANGIRRSSCHGAMTMCPVVSASGLPFMRFTQNS